MIRKFVTDLQWKPEDVFKLTPTQLIMILNEKCPEEAPRIADPEDFAAHMIEREREAEEWQAD